MKASQFQWPFIIVLASMPIVTNLVEPRTLGISSSSIAGHYIIAGGTAIWALGYAIVIGGLYMGLMYAQPDHGDEALRGLSRRWFAFLLDFILAINSVIPIVGLIPMLAEWKRTAVFSWNFVRTTHRAGDGLEVTVTTLLGIACFFAFYTFPLYKNRPTPGSCVMGYQITVAGEIPLTLRQSLFRTMLGLVAAATPFLAPILDNNRQRGQFWLDRIFGTCAVKLP